MTGQTVSKRRFSLYKLAPKHVVVKRGNLEFWRGEDGRFAVKALKSMQTDSIHIEYDGEPCEVYFFRGWGGYSHPVTPQIPVCLEDALAAESYYRAYLREVDGDQRLMKFEGIHNGRQIVTGMDDAPPPGGPKVFELIEAESGLSVGERFEIAHVDRYEKFLYHPGIYEVPFEKLCPVSRLSYSYEYDESGVLLTVTVVNFDGDTSTLDMRRRHRDE